VFVNFITIMVVNKKAINRKVISIVVVTVVVVVVSFSYFVITC